MAKKNYVVFIAEHDEYIPDHLVFVDVTDKWIDDLKGVPEMLKKHHLGYACMPVNGYAFEFDEDKGDESLYEEIQNEAKNDRLVVIGAEENELAEREGATEYRWELQLRIVYDRVCIKLVNNYSWVTLHDQTGYDLNYFLDTVLQARAA